MRGFEFLKKVFIARDVICSPYRRQRKRKTVSYGGSIEMPKKQRLSMEEKIGVIQEYLEGKVSFSESVKRGRCNRTTFQQWVKQYKSEGAEAFLPHERNRCYPPKLKLQAVRAYLAGEGS